MTRIQKKSFYADNRMGKCGGTYQEHQCCNLLHRKSPECFDKSMVKVKNSLLRPKDTIAVLWISSNEIGEEIIMEALILWEL